MKISVIFNEKRYDYRANIYMTPLRVCALKSFESLSTSLLNSVIIVRRVDDICKIVTGKIREKIKLDFIYFSTLCTSIR